MCSIATDICWCWKYIFAILLSLPLNKYALIAHFKSECTYVLCRVTIRYIANTVTRRNF